MLMVAACAFCAANASDGESNESPSGEGSNGSLKKTQVPFVLHAESKDRRGGRGKIFKGLTRSLMSPISPHTRENKRPEAFRGEASTLKGSAAAQSLAAFELELVVDESGSMLRRDCPGGVSRWEWCGEQLSDLSRQLSPYVQHGFTLTTFSSDYEVLKNATSDDVIERFEKHPSSVGTRLSLPLNSRFKHFFETRQSSSKPVLIVVITDGMPHPRAEPGLVIDSLIAASKRLKNDKELTVAILQIGHDSQEGKLFVKEIDDDLVNRGARYDIVRSLQFEELERVGLVNALVSLVRNFASEPDNSDNSLKGDKTRD